MINGYKVAALCVSEIQNENTQSMIAPAVSVAFGKELAVPAVQYDNRSVSGYGV